MTDLDTAIVSAARYLATEVLEPNADMLDTTWVTLGCGEAEAFAALFVACGATLLADTVIYDHAQGDSEPDDAHHQWCGATFDEFRSSR